jgi:hypothetical protein
MLSCFLPPLSQPAGRRTKSNDILEFLKLGTAEGGISFRRMENFFPRGAFIVQNERAATAKAIPALWVNQCEM